jgi:hypothetical protein
MLSRSDLLNNPELVQPLGSRKGVLNKPTELTIDLNDLFLSASNSARLKHNLYTIYHQNGGKSTRAKFYQLVELLQMKFAKNNKLNEYITAEADVTGFNNYVEALKTINNDFHKMVYNYLQWNVYNPFKDDIEVGPSDDRRMKKSAEIMPEDFGTLDVWREQFSQVLNRQFRNNNRIPVYRASIHARHYDRSNEGLQFNDPDRASLENPIYGYDMSRIKGAVCNYKSEDWFGFG